MPGLSGARTTGLMLFAVLVVYALLVIPTIDRQGVNWDEQTDIDIAETYAASNYGLVHGSRIDAINTRLPMYTAGLLYRLSDADRLILARWLSVAVAAITILGVFTFCLIELTRTKAVVAAALLATNPYFLFFGKQALTEGDIWISAAVAWVLVAYAHWRARPAVTRAGLVGLALGLALSAKISALALIPALLWAFWRELRDRSTEAPNAPSARRLGLLVVVIGGFLFWMAVNLVAVLGAVGIVGFRLDQSSWLAMARLLMGGVVTVGLLFWIRAQRGRASPRSADALVILLSAALAFLLLPPVHTTNPWILAALGNQFLGSGADSGFDAVFLMQSAALHLQVIVLKSSPFVGVGLIVGLVVALLRWRSRPAFRLPLAAMAFYFTFLLLLPWAQTRYMLPLLVPLVIFAADALVDLYRKRPVGALLLAGIAIVGLGYDLHSCYPDLNLNGYRWVGSRYLAGRSTVGYRSLVHTPSDGIEQSLQWLSGRARPDQSVATVYLEHHITRAVLGDPAFEVREFRSEPVDLAGVDWVVTSLNYEIDPHGRPGADPDTIFRYPHYDRSQLLRDFEKVFSVTRAFDVEVASVWKRRDPGPSSAQREESP